MLGWSVPLIAFAAIGIAAERGVPAGRGKPASAGVQNAAARRSDVAAIHAAHRAFISAFNAGDVDRAFTFLADDFVALVEETPTMDKAAYRALVAPFLERNKPSFTFEVDETVVFGSWAFERIRYSGSVTPRSGGEPRDASWRAIAIWRRGAGGWKVARYIRTPDARDRK